MNDSIPLYLGIPLALLCIAVFIIAVIFAVVIWKDWRNK